MSKKKGFQYLLDANIISDLVKDPQGAVAQKINDVGDTKVCTSIIVASEIRSSVEKRNSKN